MADPAVQAAQTYLHNIFCGTPSCALDCLEDARSVVAAVTPLIRAQAFTEAADKIEAIHRPVECANLRCKVGMFCAVCQEAEEESGCKWPCDSVAVVRGLGEETAGVDSKINTT